MPIKTVWSLIAASAVLVGCGGDLTLPSGGDPGTPPTGSGGGTLTAADDRYTTLEGASRTLTVQAPGVLGNDRVDGTAGVGLEAGLVSGPAHGQLELRPDGSLSYTPEAGWFGTDRFTYRASLDGAGSADADVALEIEPVNDSPAFTAGPDQSANREEKFGKDDDEDDGHGHGREVTVEGWATDITPGPANEADQAVTFLVEVTSGRDVLSGTPSVSPSGTLRYTPAHEGTARVEVRLQDDGGTANGGQDTSPAHTLIIVVSR
jgi:hypothetical protein